MDFNTGAGVTVINEDTWCQIGIPPVRSAVTLKTYGDHVLTTMGKCQVKLELNSKTLKLSAIITGNAERCLFGKPWINAFGLPWPENVAFQGAKAAGKIRMLKDNQHVCHYIVGNCRRCRINDLFVGQLRLDKRLRTQVYQRGFKPTRGHIVETAYKSIRRTVKIVHMLLDHDAAKIGFSADELRRASVNDLVIQGNDSMVITNLSSCNVVNTGSKDATFGTSRNIRDENHSSTILLVARVRQKHIKHTGTRHKHLQQKHLQSCCVDVGLEPFRTTFDHICQGQPNQIVKIKKRDMIRVRDHETLRKVIGIVAQLTKLMLEYRRHTSDLRIRKENTNQACTPQNNKDTTSTNFQHTVEMMQSESLDNSVKTVP
ncbi:hypothetical protein GJ496_000952 [Pomphorhynchus laevis]|nr:hypothetical protein GJ496_000952 [Pomphorhynchus laevis]